MVSRKNTPVFPHNPKEYPGYLSDEPKEDWGGPLVVDNPDGVVTAFGLGPYEVGGPKGRIDSQGAGTAKGNVGNASGMGKSMRVKGGSR